MPTFISTKVHTFDYNIYFNSSRTAVTAEKKILQLHTSILCPLIKCTRTQEPTVRFPITFSQFVPIPTHKLDIALANIHNT